MNNPTNLASQIDESQGLARHQLNASANLETTPDIDHWVLQLWGVTPGRIDCPEELGATLKDVVEQLRLTRVSDHTHYFGPGVSVVVVLSESHLSVHTWPELGYMHVDIVTCVQKLNQTILHDVFQAAFSPTTCRLAQLEY